MKTMRDLSKLELLVVNQFSSMKESMKSGGCLGRYVVYNKCNKSMYKLDKIERVDGILRVFCFYLDENDNTHPSANIIPLDYFAKNFVIKFITSSYAESNKVYALPRNFKKLVTEYNEVYEFVMTHDEEYFNNLYNKIQTIKIDSYYREVTLEQWQEALLNAEEERFIGESRAIVVDNEFLCINASAAIETLEVFEDYRNSKTKRDPRKDGDLLYKQCEHGNQFKDAIVYYAPKALILQKIMELTCVNAS